jgi:Fe(3+) dicitrate transport protein
MGVLYKFNDDYNVFTSIHKQPPGAKVVGEDAENSLNTELGFLPFVKEKFD